MTEIALKGMKVRDVMKTEVVTVSENLSITDLVDDFFFKYHYDCFPVADGGRLRGLVSLNEVKQVSRDRWDSTRVGDVMEQDLDSMSIAPDEDVSAVPARDRRSLRTAAGGGGRPGGRHHHPPGHYGGAPGDFRLGVGYWMSSRILPISSISMP